MLTDSMTHSAIAAKIKVMYGNRITAPVYEDLLKKRTVSEIAGELKESSAYSGVLSGVDPNLIHRDQLEGLLKKNLFTEHLKIMRFSQRDDKIILALLLKKYEIEQILSFLRFLKSGRSEEFIYSIPKYIIKQSSIPFERLSVVNTFEDFLSIIKPTDYYKILRHCEFEGPDIMSSLESVLYAGYYASVFKVVKNYSSGSNCDVLKSVGVKIDLFNITLILRLKKYYHLSGVEIQKQLISVHNRITKAQLKEMAEAKTVEDVFDLIGKSVYGKLFRDHKFSFTENYLYQAVYDISHKLLVFGSPSIVIPVAYLNFKEIEIKNLINIIEGKRYCLDPEEIKEHLIGVPQ